MCEALGRPEVQYLSYTPPFDWEVILATFRAHHLPHVERVDETSYERLVETHSGTACFRVVHDAEREALCLTTWNAGGSDGERIARGVRRMFDLDVDPHMIEEAMASDPCLDAIWQRYPGLRVARSWDSFEAAMTTILGQVVSVSFARVLADELMRAAGRKNVHPRTGEEIYHFPSAEELQKASLQSLRTSEARRVAIQGLAKVVAEGGRTWDHTLPAEEIRRTLRSVRGVGVWTTEYIAMRGFVDNDAFPATDYALKQELKRHAGIDVNRVRPWRAYAAIALWKSFAEAKRSKA